jgi:hypothetical protein
MFFEALEDILPDMTIYINTMDENGNPLEMILPLEPFIEEER